MRSILCDDVLLCDDFQDDNPTVLPEVLVNFPDEGRLPDRDRVVEEDDNNHDDYAMNEL